MVSQPFARKKAIGWGTDIYSMAVIFNHKPGLVVYLTAGDPSLEASKAIALAAIDAGADVIELGVPFSDPLGDGPVIQRASERAISRGTRLADVLKLAAEIRAARARAGLVIFSYLNPILHYGLHSFADEAAAAGADAVLVIDLIVEEAGEYLAEMARVGLAPIFLAAPTSPDERLEAIATHSRGFIYAISRVGITGQQQSLAADAAALVARIRRWTGADGKTLPVAVGFGISNAEHVAQVAEFADAAVIGSAIVELIERSTLEGGAETAPGAVARFIMGLHLSAAADSAGPVKESPLAAVRSA
jgi:tryptophan synthase alpha chain